MSLLLIRGPERRAHGSEPPPPLPARVVRALAERTAAAGKTLAVRVCANEAEYLHALAQGLGLDKAAVNAIHEKVGVINLYA